MIEIAAELMLYRWCIMVTPTMAHNSMMTAINLSLLMKQFNLKF